MGKKATVLLAIIILASVSFLVKDNYSGLITGKNVNFVNITQEYLKQVDNLESQYREPIKEAFERGKKIDLSPPFIEPKVIQFFENKTPETKKVSYPDSGGYSSSSPQSSGGGSSSQYSGGSTSSSSPSFSQSSGDSTSSSSSSQTSGAPTQPQNTNTPTPLPISQQLEETGMRVIISLKDPNFKESVLNSLGSGEFLMKTGSSDWFAGYINKNTLNELQNNLLVGGVVEDKKLYTATAESFPLIGQDQVVSGPISGITVDGSSQTVCHIDSGIEYNNTALGGNGNFLGTKVIDGYDYCGGNTNPCGVSDADPIDEYGHGTATAGIIASNGTYIGIAPNAALVAMKVTANDLAYISNVIDGIDGCVAKKNAGSNIGVIYIGLASSGTEGDQTNCKLQDFGALYSSVQQAIDRNITVVAPSGNVIFPSQGAIDGISFPSCLDNIVSVASVDDGGGDSPPADTFSGWSNRGAILNLLAPGDLITTLKFGGGTETSKGTSLAAAHVAGATVLLKDFYRKKYNLDLTQDQIKDIFNKTGKRVTDPATGITKSRINISEAIGDIVTPPTNFSFISPSLANNTNTTNSTLDIAFSFREFSVNESWMQIGFPSGAVENRTALIQSLGLPYNNATLGLTSLSGGTYNFTMFANDTFGNQGTNSSLYKITIDTANPSILAAGVTYPTGQTKAKPSDQINISANLIDSQSGVKNATFLAAINVCTSNAILTLSSDTLYNGVCTIKPDPSGGDNPVIMLRVYDFVERWVQSGIQVNIDKATPRTTVNSPVNAIYNSPTINLDAGADETINTWWYSLNGGDNTTFSENTISASATITGQEGSNSLIISANDSADNLNSTVIYFNLDTTAPNSFRFISPTKPNNFNSPNSTLDLVFQFSELNSYNATLQVGSPTGTYTNFTTIPSSGIARFSLSSLQEGTHNFTMYANDTAGNQGTNSSLYKITIDTTAPNSFRFISPTKSNNTNSSNSTLDMAFGFTELNPDIALIQAGYPNGTSENETATLSGTTARISLIGLPEGSYNFTMFANDIAGNQGTNSSLYKTAIDTTKPTATANTITYPSGQASATNTQTVILNATVTDSTGIQSASVDASNLGCSPTLSLTKQSSTNFYIATCTLTGAITGTKSILISATDFAGNQNLTSSLTVEVDTDGPSIMLNSPGDASSPTSPVTFNITATDTLNVNNVTLLIDGIANTTNTSGVSGEYMFTLSVMPGSHNWSVLAYDSIGNLNQSGIRTLTIKGPDITSPTNFRFISPTKPNNFNTSNSTLDMAFSYIEINPNVTILQTGFPNGSLVNRTNIQGNISSFSFFGLQDGPHNFTMFANDTSGNWGTNSSVYRINIDKSSPASLRYISPTLANNTLRTNSTLDFHVAFNETSPDFANLSVGFGNNGSAVNKSMTIIGAGSNAQATRSLLGLPDGRHNFTVYVTDKANNQARNSTVYYIIVDTVSPSNFRFISPTKTNNTNSSNKTLDIAFSFTEINPNSGILQVGFPNGTLLNKTQTTSSSTSTFSLSGLFDGSHNFTMFANDTTGNQGTNFSLYRIIIDTTLPIATPNTTTYPSGQTKANNGQTVTLSAIVTDLTSGVNTVIVDASSLGCSPTLSLIKQGATTYTANCALVGAMTGTKSLPVTATDFAGNQNNPASLSVEVDTSAPILSITSPPNNAYLSASSISITGTASDPSPDTITINDTSFGSNAGDYFNWVFTNPSIPEGNRSVKITAKNLAGNTQTAITTFTIDRTKPSALTFNPPTLADGSTILTNSYTVSLSFTDANPNTCTFNDGSSPQPMARVGNVCAITLSGQSDGIKTYTVQVTDLAGNSETTIARTVKIDTSKPSVTANPTTYPSGQTKTKTGDQVILSVTATDADGIQSVSVGAGNVCTGTVTLTPQSGSLYTGKCTIKSSPTEGTNSLQITATDLAGNQNNPTSLTVEVDTTNPSVTLNSPANNAILASSQTFDITATDASGIKNVTLFINGIADQTDISGTSGNYIFTKNLASGTYSWSVLVYDKAGNPKQSETRSVSIDSSSPTISIISPSNNVYLSSSTIYITGTASDSNPDIITVNDTRFGSNLGTYSNWRFGISGLADGIYSVKITARDTTGNTQSSVVTFTIDKTLSTNLQFASPTPSDGAVISSSSFTVSTTFIETNPNNCLLEIVGFGNTSMSRTGTTCIATTPSQSDGTKSYKFYVTDLAGNQAASPARIVIIDTSKSIVTANPTNYPSGQTKANNGQTITLNATVTDTTSGVNTVIVDASSLGCSPTLTMSPQGSNTYIATCTLTGVTTGTKSLPVTATDLAGNQNNPASLTVEVDTTIGLPDIQLKDFRVTYPQNPNTAQNTIFYFVIKNIGTGAASDVEWLINYGDGFINQPDKFQLAPGGEVVVTDYARFKTKGSHTVTAKVDQNNKITEASEANNEMAITVMVS